MPLCASMQVGILSVFLLLLAFLVFWKYWFLRQPRRTIPEQGIISPASGKLVRILPYTNGTSAAVPKGLLGVVKTLTADVASSGYILVIMLSPLDVHYQRAPIA